MDEKKITIFLISLGMILIVITGILIFSFNEKEGLTGRVVNEYTHTRAVCDENNLCQDYKIACQGEKLIDIKPTGFIVQNPEDWEDPRSKDEISQWCNASE
ncbi:MAG: hypothetical protein Q8P15_03245 [Nanoarchaeota archaeon]|nr:hypothetical protein [Nanoarchaeota archaeon]